MTWRRAFLVGLALLCAGDVARSGSSTLPYSDRLRDPEVWSSDWLANWMALRTFDPDTRTFLLQIQLAALSQAAGATDNALGSDSPSAAFLVAANAGLDRAYLLKIAQRESGLNPLAKAKRSSAAGLFQFTENTWLCMILDAGPRLGVGGGFGLERAPDGRCRVEDNKERVRLLSLRYDPVISTKLAGAFTSANEIVFMEAFGRRPDDHERYVLHVFGAGGGTRLLQLERFDPDQAAAPIMPEAARANPAIFFERNGRPRTVAQVVDRLKL